MRHRHSVLASTLFTWAGLAAASILASCGGEPEQPGLILSKSVFAAGSTPQPATMMLLRPPSEPDSPWTSEDIITKPGSLRVQPGTAADGTVVFRLTENDLPVGDVVTLEPAGDAWAPVAAPAYSIDSVDWQTKDGAPATKDYEMAGGNVFHKAMWWDPLFGEPGILTISANMPFLQIWRKAGEGWTPELLWTANVGGREQRFRDIEIGDVDGDGQDELVIVTHDRGAVFLLEQTEAGLDALKLHEWDERIFVHEVEIGDVDGDGVPEIFTTPSEPNKLDGNHQAGWVDMYRYEPESGQYARSTVVHLPESHAKEILTYDYDEDGSVELYVAIETETNQFVSASEGEPVSIQAFTWDAARGEMVAGAAVELEGCMCRFLCGGDTDGDGNNELIASTNNGGIYLLKMSGSQWESKRIVAPYASGGFEHATILLDFDGDGSDELFVANDAKDHVLRVHYDAESGRYKRDKIYDMSGENYMAWNVMELPAGL